MAESGVRGSTRIEASADHLYALISDITQMGSWSPENTGGRWLDGEPPGTVGARFVGSNQRGWRRWSTVCTVTQADPGRRFGFDVAFTIVPISRWSYDFEPDGGATVVTESWVDLRPGWFALFGGPVMGVGDLRAHHLDNIERTLANLKATAERRT